MAAVNNVTTPSSSITTKTAADAAKATTGDTQDRFLTLLVTQMKNQDPLNPMDNAQLTSQLAQIGAVTGIDKLNTTLQALTQNFATNQSLQASSMIGHGVLTAGTGITLDNGQAIGGVELKEAADKVLVSIKDPSGNVIDSIDLGSRDAGVFAYSWDGKNGAGTSVSSGQYSVTIKAQRGTTNIDAQPLSLSMVRSVTPDPQGAVLDVGTSKPIKLSDVRHIL